MLIQKSKFLSIILICSLLIGFCQLSEAAPNRNSVLGNIVAVDNNDNLYVAQFGGDFWISYNQGEKYTHKSFKGLIWDLKVYHNKIYVLSQDSDHPVIFVSSDKGKNFQQINVPYNCVPQELVVDSKENIYIATFGAGILIIHNDAKKSIEIKNHVNSNLLYDCLENIFIDKNDKIYATPHEELDVRTNGVSISKVEKGKLIFDSKNLDLTNKSLLTGINVDSVGNIYISAYGDIGLVKSKDGGKNFFVLTTLSPLIYGEYIDKANIIYLVGRDEYFTPILLVSYDLGSNFYSYSKESGLDGGYLESLAVDSKGNIYTTGSDDDYIFIGKSSGKKITFVKSQLK